MKIPREQVCVLIPTLNEEPTIGIIILKFLEIGYSDILVIDGNSIDKTREIASASGATVIVQEGKGKGSAFIQAIKHIKKPYIILIDGDNTYDPEQADALISPLLSGYDQTIGNRLCGTNTSAFHRLNLLGNRILNWLFKVSHGRYLYDILTGYRAFTLESLQRMRLYEEGFGIETEISAEAVRNDDRVAIIPVTYGERVGSDTKLDPIHDGLKIGRTIYRLAKLNNPLFYFGIIGLSFLIAGGVIGIYIIIDWLKNIDHIPLTILAVTLIIVGVQIIMFGIQSDIQLANQREFLHEVRKLRKER
ncbi:S-layer glycoprotein N-glycosyltransferase AglJ [Methanospirillum sp. J.3.6.1-F.2.7.3]|uniref:S-layer glycoprotein N-glycosyltransferase AglJ n=3 Tax=Methanospirillum TaxID=2202 RepID=A0A8E7B241_9EURY|nr:S-layer glycoprotein N-glycosyltransferase AglJ [Methanospirillum sp. J.3.6.1-F.2.7.3]QVV90604.1 S-layer glycoprotein N-glycosyltransferase AglJ [Methanospirillum sp. J.3.6.1-F.2.7.3]QXO96315.1 S-layer glycoprotein N-glycosyltransferase AglJ [Methanospirillum hungatei]